MNEILEGNCVDVLKTLPAESVDCCITSPPYWGLRDYGTAEWEGGSENCDHKLVSDNTKQAKTSTLGGSKRNVGNALTGYKEMCKCGAKRKDSQLGLEKTPEEYVENMVNVFREVHRVLKKDGTCWLNIGDSYFNTQNSNRNGLNGSLGGDVRGGGEYKTQRREHETLKPKDLVGIPWRVALALQADGWYLRQDIIWAKPNPMPESVTDRCTKSHEYVFLLTKSASYYFDSEAIKEKSISNRPDMATNGIRTGLAYLSQESVPSNSIKTRQPHKTAITPGQTPHGKALKRMGGEKDPAYETRNKRSVWTITTKPYKEAHFATFPEDLVMPMIKTTRKDAVILDPFMGAGTTGLVAIKLQRKYLGIELNPKYIEIARERIRIVEMQPAML